MSWTDSVITPLLLLLIPAILQRCSCKSAYASNDQQAAMFAEQFRKDLHSNNGQRGVTSNDALDALLGTVPRVRDIPGFNHIMYENMAESKMAAYKDLAREAAQYNSNNDPGYLQSNEIPAGSDPPYWVAPKYMIELYNKFETDRYSHPMANIVRSFVNIHEEPVVKSYGNKIKAEMRRHLMKFNISSVSRDEEIHLAELRLYTLVEADRKIYFGNDRRVSIYEVLDDDESLNKPFHYDLVASKDNVYGSQNGWETFTITDSVKKWVRNDVEMKSLEVRIETIKSRYYSLDIDIDIDTNPHQEHEPLLVVFSNDKKKRKSEQRELHEMFMHYASNLEEEVGDDYVEDEYSDEYVDDSESNGVYKRDTRRVLEKLRKSTSVEREHVAINNMVHSKLASSKKSQSSKEMSKQQQLMDFYKTILEIDKSVDLKNGTSTRVKRSKAKNKKARRNSCRRKPLQVKFRDIKWDSWIIAPKSYDAYECTGRCYFPMNDHLTPTKHAIIQTLLHTNYPNKATRACCVPTKLDPISILYVDEKGVVTYKYKYEGMVVAQCGCR